MEELNIWFNDGISFAVNEKVRTANSCISFNIEKKKEEGLRRRIED